jgi:RNA polymerase sigma factor (sigma-70 family)
MTEDDEQLLRRYAEERSESAFAEIVGRYIDLVYATALRVVNGDAHLARDVTQTVFIQFARKAPSLPRSILLAGWLHRHTCFAASSAVRAERRRKTREQTAMQIRALDDTGEAPWEGIAPYLDESLNQLSSPDRDALVLRFLKRQDLRAVGAALGISEDTAQKRVSRALEKLRGILSRRGVALTAAALASVLSSKAAIAAPAGLTAGVASTAFAAAAKAGTTFTIFNLMAGTKLQAGVLGVVVIASVLTPIGVQYQAQARLNDQRETMRQQQELIIAAQHEQERLTNSLTSNDATRPAVDPQFAEVLRLRGEVGRLQQIVADFHTAKTNEPLSRDEVLDSMRQMYADRVERMKKRFADSPNETVPEMQYVTEERWIELVTYDHHRIDADFRHAMSSIRSSARIRFATGNLSPALRAYCKAHNGQFPTDVSELKPWFKSPVDDAVLQDWVVVPTSNMPAEIRVDGDWAIMPRGAVHPELDQGVGIGVRGIHLGSGGSNDWFYVP